MATILETQKDFRSVYEQPFCYICGKSLLEGEELDDDHVPPSGIFAPQDRQTPLILRTHASCNRGQSAMDQIVAQVIGPVRGRVPSHKDRKIDIRLHKVGPGTRTGILRGQELTPNVQRWVRGFHAALYRELLPPAPVTGYMTILPFPQGRHDGEKFQPDPIPDAYLPFLNVIEEARTTDQVDRIVCRNGKCRYDCIWTPADDGLRWLCIYRLDIYNWSELGDVNNYERRECVGAYIRPDRGAPDGATKAPRSDQGDDINAKRS